MLNKLAATLTVATVLAATVAVAHPAHYAMAVADTKIAALSLPAEAYTALAGDVSTARAEALAQCRKATERDCVVIGSGVVKHAH